MSDSISSKEGELALLAEPTSSGSSRRSRRSRANEDLAHSFWFEPAISMAYRNIRPRGKGLLRDDYRDHEGSPPRSHCFRIIRLYPLHQRFTSRDNTYATGMFKRVRLGRSFDDGATQCGLLPFRLALRPGFL
jgi:hypothetical protein